MAQTNANMHFMAVKNSRTRSGFLIYSYFKDSVFTEIIFPLLGFLSSFQGNMLHNPSQYYSPSEKLVVALVVIGAECGAETISS